MNTTAMSPRDQVGRQVRRGLSWNLAGAVATNAMRIVVLAVLGRALTPSDFGIVAAAVSVNVIFFGIRDIGIGRALVQRPNLDDGHLTTTFAVQIYLGLSLTTLLVLSAPLIGRFFGISASVDVLRALAALFLLRGLASTSRMITEREMRFRASAIIDAGTFALGSIASMATAVAGAGPWALVIGYIVEEGLATVSYLIVSPPKLSLRVDRTRLRELMSFGTGQTITQMAGVLATYGDNVVVGNVLGPRALGFYARAYDLIKLPSFIFEAVVAKVLFPAFSRIQDERERLAIACRRGKFANAIVLLPASAVLIVVAPEVIRILVGDGWGSSVLPLRILAVTVLPRTSQKLSAIITQAAGRANAVAFAYVIYMIIVIGGAAITSRWGIPGVAASTALAIIVVYSQSTFYAMQVCRLSLGELFRAHVPGLVLSGLVMAVALPVADALRARGAGPAIIVLAVVAAGLAPYLVVIAAWLRRGHGDFAWLRGELRRVWRMMRPGGARGPG
ncbi:MAG TPA: lipopolysaccharide biosynthesis protein [Kofleriaceae bacterium]|nr:lipopolysaccharide biosynthesis protein [Kofleriaceae bacterium]